MPPILEAIAYCESGKRQFKADGTVLRGRVDPHDVGYMQINERYHLAEAERLGYNIYTLKGNKGYATYLYRTQGTSPWNASRSCWG